MGGGGKETPRQKMIGMMYLVLTALLALNVTKDILNAFVILNDGLEATAASIDDKTDSQMASFSKAMGANKTKTEPYYNKANDVKKMSDELSNYLTMCQALIIKEAEKKETIEEVMGRGADGLDTIINLGLVNSKDNYDIPIQLMLGSEPLANPKEGEYTAKELEGKLADYRDKLKTICQGNDPLQANLDQVFDFSDVYDTHLKKDVYWGYHLFDHTPIVGAVSILTKLKNDVKKAETDVLEHLLASIGADDFKFNKLSAVVNYKNGSYIALGDSFNADIFLAAVDTTQQPEIELNGEPLKVDDGVGQIRRKPTSAQDNDWKGIIKFKAKDGIREFPFNVKFKVSEADAVLDATKMNVFYSTIANPLAVSIPGVDPASINVSCSTPGIKIKKVGTGKFEITPSKDVKNDSQIKISASASKGGKNKQLGEKTFRVRRLPPASARVFGKGIEDGSIPESGVKRADKLEVNLGRDFLFDGLKYTVVSFDLKVKRGGLNKLIPNQGSAFNAEVKSAMGQLRKGMELSFRNIKAKGPDGTVQGVLDLTLDIE